MMEKELDLKTWVMTTGSRGLHVEVPLDTKAEFETVREFAKGVAKPVASRHPDDFTTETHKKKRKGRLFLDYLRNSYAQTSVAPYFLRGRPGAPIATPLSWDEVGRKPLNARSYTISNIFRRLARKDDPWLDIDRNPQSLESASEILTSLLPEILNQD